MHSTAALGEAIFNGIAMMIGFLQCSASASADKLRRHIEVLGLCGRETRAADDVGHEVF